MAGPTHRGGSVHALCPVLFELLGVRPLSALDGDPGVGVGQGGLAGVGRHLVLAVALDEGA